MVSMREIHGSKENPLRTITDEKGRYRGSRAPLGEMLDEGEWPGSTIVGDFGILRAMFMENRCMDVIRERECAGRDQPMDGCIHRASAAGHRFQHTYRT